MTDLKHKLVYSFYVYPDYYNNIVNRIHLNALKYYSHIFDDAVFTIIIDDTNNTDLIKDIQKRIIDCGFTNNTTFKVIGNTGYRESNVFKNEIDEKLEEYEGLVFFAHNKGVSNIMDDNSNEQSIYHWILGMYFLNLNFIEEVNEEIGINGYAWGRYFYGAFMTEAHLCDDLGDKTTFYSGTFYWINTRKVANSSIKRMQLFDRTFSEMYPTPFAKIDKLASHEQYLLYAWNPYVDDVYRKICFLLGHNEEDIKCYEDFYNMIMV